MLCQLLVTVRAHELIAINESLGNYVSYDCTDEKNGVCILLSYSQACYFAFAVWAEGTCVKTCTPGVPVWLHEAQHLDFAHTALACSQQAGSIAYQPSKAESHGMHKPWAGTL